VGRKRYDPRRVIVTLVEKRRSSWKWGGTILGTEYRYAVVDGNFDRLNHWEFIVSEPKTAGQVVVCPVQVPGKSVFADLGRRSITFARANRQGYRGRLYCKVFLSDPTGEKNRRGTRGEQRGCLPRWFGGFGCRLREKGTVATTRGKDGAALVCLVDPGDHERMIRLYFAMRVWVLQERFKIE